LIIAVGRGHRGGNAARTVGPRHIGWLIVAEFTILTVFAIEYILRLACSPKPLSYAFSFWGIIDFIAIVPGGAVPLSRPHDGPGHAATAAPADPQAAEGQPRARPDRAGLRADQGGALIFLFVGTVILYLAAVGIYHFEHIAQPEAFGSIPASLWWALATLTTVGYGDVVPITTGGRIFTGLVLMVGIGIVAVPAGLITASLLNNRTGGATPPAFDGDLPNTQKHPTRRIRPNETHEKSSDSYRAGRRPRGRQRGRRTTRSPSASSMSAPSATTAGPGPMTRGASSVDEPSATRSKPSYAESVQRRRDAERVITQMILQVRT
jgi:voltage-gated potassium channel